MALSRTLLPSIATFAPGVVGPASRDKALRQAGAASSVSSSSTSSGHLSHLGLVGGLWTAWAGKCAVQATLPDYKGRQDSALLHWRKACS